MTEYEDTCPIVEKEKVVSVDHFDPANYSFLLWKRSEWIFKRRYLDEEKTLKDFGNPLCRIDINRYTFCLEQGDDKISLKLFCTTKSRRPGVTWFKRNSDITFISYNTKNKNFYFGQVGRFNSKKKSSRKLVCNYFGNLANSIYTQLLTLSKQPDTPEYPNGKLIDMDHVNRIFSQFYNLIGIESKESYFDLSDDLYKKYLTDRNFKIPNNYLVFKNAGNKPLMRLFKKNQYRLVETYMQHYGLKGDKIRKLLHTIESVDFFGIKKLLKIFPIDFLLQRPVEELEILFKKDVHFLCENYFTSFKEVAAKVDMNNFYLTYLDFVKRNNGLHSLQDHLRFYVEIKKHEKVKWKAKDVSSFKLEHIEFTDKYDFYTHGHYDREFDNDFVNFIEKPFIVDGVKYTPILFESHSQYIEESSHQSNCVKTYNPNLASIIISLRNDSQERLTMQFTPRKVEKGKVLWKNTQTRARFNGNPGEKWEEAISIFEQRFLMITDFALPKVWFVNYNSRTPVDLIWGLKGNITTLTSVNTGIYGNLEF